MDSKLRRRAHGLKGMPQQSGPMVPDTGRAGGHYDCGSRQTVGRDGNILAEWRMAQGDGSPYVSLHACHTLLDVICLCSQLCGPVRTDIHKSKKQALTCVGTCVYTYACIYTHMRTCIYIYIYIYIYT